MTIKIKVVCDGRGCHSDRDIEDNHDSDVESEGYHVHPHDGYQHYCPTCWPIVEKEILGEG